MLLRTNPPSDLYGETCTLILNVHSTGFSFSSTKKIKKKIRCGIYKRTNTQQNPSYISLSKTSWLNTHQHASPTGQKSAFWRSGTYPSILYFGDMLVSYVLEFLISFHPVNWNLGMIIQLHQHEKSRALLLLLICLSK